MAGKNRRKTVDLKEALYSEYKKFSLIQAVRAVRYLIEKDKGKSPDISGLFKTVKIHPELSLNFPETEITGIKEILDKENPDEINSILIRVTFLGLYGISSPLPTFYTEELFEEEADDRSIKKDFLDIINAPLYEIYFKIWSKYRLFYNIAEHHDRKLLNRIFCLIGLGEESFRKKLTEPQKYLKYTGIFTQFPRSAEGLRSILSDVLAEPTVKILQCMPDTADIPEDQINSLGEDNSKIGINCCIGSRIKTINRKFRVRIGYIPGRKFISLLPDKQAFELIGRMIKSYLNQPFIWDIEIVLKTRMIRQTQLGTGPWCRLGWNTWLFSNKDFNKEVSVVLEPGKEVFHD